MDGRRFDNLARSLVVPGSRRRLLGGLAGGALGALGLRGADAATCRMPGNLCRENANCCSGLCGPKDATLRRRCLCQTVADCPAPDQCHAATCIAGVCGESVLAGQACNDGNPCTTGETCQANGTCAGGAPTVCAPQDQCHSASCNIATGCVQTALTGTACNADNSLCTQNDTCQNGTCVPGTAVVCNALDECHVAGTCDPTTGTCSNPLAPSGTPCTPSGGGNGTCDASGICQACAGPICGTPPSGFGCCAGGFCGLGGDGCCHDLGGGVVQCAIP